MKKFLCFVIIIITISIITTGYVGYGKVLIIENKVNNATTEFYLPNNTFSLGYIHSVMKTPCEEFFIATSDNKMDLEKIVYESYGVGLPFLPEEGQYELIDDKFVLKMSRTFNEINMVISPIPKHWLCIGDIKYDLMELSENSDSSIKLYIADKIVFKK